MNGNQSRHTLGATGNGKRKEIKAGMGTRMGNLMGIPWAWDKRDAIWEGKSGRLRQ